MIAPERIDVVDVAIRPMVATDIEAVARIERQSFASSWNASAYLTELSNPAALYLVAERAGAVVGYGGLWLVMDEAHVTTLAVAQAQRGKKIGERLLCSLLLASQRRGATRATLEVRASNRAAHGLYAKYGFTWAAIRKNYYPDSGENADILWIHDMTRPEWRTLFDTHRAALGL